MVLCNSYSHAFPLVYINECKLENNNLKIINNHDFYIERTARVITCMVLLFALYNNIHVHVGPYILFLGPYLGTLSPLG